MTTTTPKRRRKPAPTTAQTSRRQDVVPDPHVSLARRLATLADLHLQQGFHAAAELLALRAERVREGAAHAG